MIDAVVIEGVRFPVAYNGYTYSRNKIWSKNTGRNDYGEMVGTIVALKDKIELQLPPLTGEQALLLDNAVSDIDNPYLTAQVLFLGGTQKEMTIYTGDVIYPYLTIKISARVLLTGTMCKKGMIRMSRVDDTLNKINFRSDYPYNGKIESLLKIIAINSAIICDKLDTISNQLKGGSNDKRRNS